MRGGVLSMGAGRVWGWGSVGGSLMIGVWRIDGSRWGFTRIRNFTGWLH